MKKLKEFLVWFSKQKLSGKLAIGCAGTLFLCCFCGLVSSITNPNTPTPNPSLTSTAVQLQQDAVPTFTSQAATATIEPTSTMGPTVTPLATETAEATATTEPTVTPLPTETATAIPTTAVPPTVNPGTLEIVRVNKGSEYVDIQNVSGEPITLNGWVLVSERGNQSCGLGGIIQPGEVLRIWAQSGTPGFSCGYSGPIWNNNETDPAVLYNPQGQEIDRFP